MTAQFIVTNGFVECPACGLHLTKLAEQDRRVIDALVAAAMVHSVAVSLPPVIEPMVAWG